MYKDIKDIITLSTEACWKGDMTSRILWKLCRYMGAGPSSFIGKFQETNYLTFEDTLGYLIKHYINKNVDFNKKVNVNIQEESKIILTMNRLGDETREDMTNIYLALKSQDKEETLKVLLYNYLNATGFMYKSADKNRSITGLVQYIINLSKKDGIDKMKEFLRVTEQLEYGNMAIQGPKVTLTTIHSAKGREWKNVIMFGCDNVSMPNVESIACMVTNGALDSDINDYIDEERRLFYVGNTRAKENLLVITYENPSYFVMESLGMFGNSVNEGKDNNSEIIKFSNTPDLASELNKDFIMKMGDKDNKYSKI
jgi:superfamily I DNA/RNA helicase